MIKAIAGVRDRMYVRINSYLVKLRPHIHDKHSSGSALPRNRVEGNPFDVFVVQSEECVLDTNIGRPGTGRLKIGGFRGGGPATHSHTHPVERLDAVSLALANV